MRFSVGFFMGAAALLTSLAVAREASADPSTTSPEQGYSLGEIQSPRALAFGGAQNALGVSTNALYANPANLALARVYHFEALASISPEARRQSYGGAVVDSATSRLAGGIGGSYNSMDPDGIHRKWTDIRLVLAYPFGDRISVGMTGRYLRVSQDISKGPLGASLASDGTPGGPMFNEFTFDLGATVLVTQGLRVGLVGHNLTNPGTSLAPTTLAGGVGYAFDMFAIEGDAQFDFTTWKSPKGRYMAGGEIFLAQHFPIRLGYRYDDGFKTHALSGGLGFVDRKWSFEISGQHDIAGDLPMTMVSAALRLFYDGGGGDIDTTNDAF